MKISVEKMLSLQMGLAALDGYDKIVRDGEREKFVRVFYSLGGGVRLAIAKNINLVGAAIKAYSDARNKLIADLSGGKNKVPDDKVPEFMKSEREMLDDQQEVPLVALTEDQLKLDENPIPGSVLSFIEPIIKGAQP